MLSILNSYFNCYYLYFKLLNYYLNYSEIMVRFKPYFHFFLSFHYPEEDQDCTRKNFKLEINFISFQEMIKHFMNLTVQFQILFKIFIQFNYFLQTF